MELTYDEAYALKNFIEDNLFDDIRKCPEADSIHWLITMCEIYKKCKEITGDRE